MITAPLTIEQVRSMVGNKGENVKVIVILSLTLGDLIGHDIDGLNDLMDDRILPKHEDIIGTLSDITYRVVGHVPGNQDPRFLDTGSVLVEVSGEVEVSDEA